MPNSRPTVIVIGGGPAGSTAARLLAEWGHTVTLVAKQDGRLNLAESLPPSVAKLLEHIGTLDAVDAGGFYRTTGNTVWWGDPEGRSENFLRGAEGYQIERALRGSPTRDGPARRRASDSRSCSRSHFR